MLRKNKHTYKRTCTDIYHQHSFKTQLYFLFVSCRLFLKRKLLALQITISNDLIFFPRKHAYHFHCPFIYPSIYPSILPFLPHYPIIVLSLVCEREEDRREEEKEEERKMASFLLVCLCLSVSCLSRYGLIESGHFEPMSI